jgi:hypothetical protein
MLFNSIPILLLAVISTSSAFAGMRSWKNADQSRSVKGEFIKRNATSVTIRNEAGKEYTIELTNLHIDDRNWLDANQSNDGVVATPSPVADPSAFFENLTFRDSRETTLMKLKVSKILEMTTAETFIGRSGLNGVFKMREKVGNLDRFLYFDWTESGKLTEVNLQTDLRPETDYKTELELCWKQLAEQLTLIYGKPIQKGPLPSIESVGDGIFFPSHLWKMQTGGCVMLGTAREGSKYQVVVRYSQKKPQVIEIP